MSVSPGPRRRRPRHGLRVTVRLGDLVVGQSVRWSRRPGALDGAAELVPTADDGPLARVRWLDDARLEVVPGAGGGPGGLLVPGERITWEGPAGLVVELELVREQRARRFGGAGGGDVVLFTTVLALLVAVGQVRTLAAVMWPGTAPGHTTLEPSPELIARLLRRDLSGLPDGDLAPPEASDELVLPAGAPGPVTAPGGGAREGPRRQPGVPGAGGLAARRLPPAEALPREPPPPEGPSGDPPSRVRVAEGTSVGLTGTPSRGGDELPAAIERFIGWGFRDWLRLPGAPPAATRRVEAELAEARRRLAIDPDDPWALQVLGYYAYLAENLELAREAFERAIRLYPGDPSGYNNLALVYKRTRDYRSEEALYRQALEMDPLDTHVLNNLAVNLAHQGRGDEALRVLARVRRLQPAGAYVELHQAKVLAAMGRRQAAYRHLARALDRVDELDAMHHVEFRQDLRVDPAFDELRRERRFRRMVRRRYGDTAWLGAAASRDTVPSEGGAPEGVAHG